MKYESKNNVDNQMICEYVSWNEIIKYQIVKKLGDGMFSQVFECIETQSGKHFAIK